MCEQVKVEQPKIYGYVRISTREQSIERQIRNIKKEYEEAIIIQEVYTGTKIEERRQFMKLLNKVKKGDVIVFDSVSRMSRNAESGFTLYQKLYNEGINLVFLKEGYINTDVYRKSIDIVMPEIEDEISKLYMEATKKAMMILAKRQIEEAFKQAEKEVMDLRQRTKEGMQTAKLNGKQIGGIKGKKLETKKSIKAKEIIKKKSKYFGGNLSDKDLIAVLKNELGTLNKDSFYKYKKEIKAELEEEAEKLGIMKGQVSFGQEVIKETKSIDTKLKVDDIEQEIDKMGILKPYDLTDIDSTTQNLKIARWIEQNKERLIDIWGNDVELLEADGIFLVNVCLEQFQPQDVITYRNLVRWLKAKETQRIIRNCNSYELIPNLLLLLDVSVKVNNRLVTRFYTDKNSSKLHHFTL